MAIVDRHGLPLSVSTFIHYNGHLEVHSSLLSVVLNEQGRTATRTTGDLPTANVAVELNPGK
jgi:hypothetical protein